MHCHSNHKWSEACELRKQSTRAALLYPWIIPHSPQPFNKHTLPIWWCLSLPVNATAALPQYCCLFFQPTQASTCRLRLGGGVQDVCSLLPNISMLMYLFCCCNKHFNGGLSDRNTIVVPLLSFSHDWTHVKDSKCTTQYTSHFTSNILFYFGEQTQENKSDLMREEWDYLDKVSDQLVVLVWLGALCLMPALQTQLHQHIQYSICYIHRNIFCPTYNWLCWHIVFNCICFCSQASYYNSVCCKYEFVH